MAFLAYFDANVVGHLHALDSGVTRAMRAEVEHAVESGRLVVAASTLTFEELVSRKDPDERYALTSYFLELATLSVVPKGVRELLTESIRSYADDRPDPDPLLYLDAEDRVIWKRLARGGVAESELADLHADAEEQIQTFLTFMSHRWAWLQERVKQARKDGQPFGREEQRAVMRRTYAEAFAEEAGVLAACQSRGLPGLLQRRRVAAAVGVAVELLLAHGLDGRRPRRGDSRDSLHVVSAASMDGCSLVTHDGSLRRIVEQIPSLGLRVRNVEGLCRELA